VPPAEEAEEVPPVEEAAPEPLVQEAEEVPPVEEAAPEPLVQEAEAEPPVEEAEAEPPAEEAEVEPLPAPIVISRSRGVSPAAKAKDMMGTETLSLNERLQQELDEARAELDRLEKQRLEGKATMGWAPAIPASMSGKCAWR